MSGILKAIGASQTKALPQGTTTNGLIRWQLLAAGVSILPAQDIASKTVEFPIAGDGTYEITGQHLDANGNLFGDVISSGEVMVQDNQIVSTFSALSALTVTFTADLPAPDAPVAAVAA